MKVLEKLCACLLVVLLTAALFMSLVNLNRATETVFPDDPALAEAARERLVFLDPGSAREEGGKLVYELVLPEPDTLCVFQPKANGAGLTVNDVPAESFGLQEQNLFVLSTLQPEGGVYRLEITARGGNANNLSLFLGTLDAIISCQSTLFLSRFLALGINALVCLVSLVLFLKKRSERYLLALSLYAFARLFSSLYFTIAHLLEGSLPALGRLYMALFRLPLGQWMSFFLYALLQFLVLRSFAPTKIGRLSLFVPIAVSSLPMLFFPTESETFQFLRFASTLVAAACYLLSLYRMDRKNWFRALILGLALAVSTAAIAFVQLSQTGLAPYGAVNFRVHLSILLTCVYPVAYLLLACDQFAGKFQEADTLNLELEQRIRESTQQHTLFIRSMLHNLKTPLFSLSGYSDMAAASVRTDPERSAGAIAKIKENAVYVGHLLDQLFLLTQMDAGQVALEPIDVCLTELLENVCETTGLAAQKKDVRLTADIPEDLYIAGDPLYLRQAIQNIADNAVVHTPAGGTITLTARAEGEGCRVTVEDTGCGIEPEELPRIFDRYYSNRHGGRASSGLGLTISKMLIEQSGGSITAASRAGEGACFTITLPGPEEDHTRQP